MKITVEDIKHLQEILAKNPEDTDVINSLALGYMENPSLITDNEDLKFLEKAYQTKKTIKSTHNLAWFYYMEFGGSLERAIEIQQECISMNPSSFYPYFLYGCMMLEKNQYSEAIKYLGIAYSKDHSSRENSSKENSSKEPLREITHNLGTAYAKSGELSQARNYLILASNNQDIECKSKYNLAIVKTLLEEKKNAFNIVEELKQTIIDNGNKFDDVDALDVAYLYYLLEDDKSAYECCLISNWEYYDLFSWEHVPYLIYKFNRETYQKLVESEIQQRNNYIKQINDNHQDWEDYTQEEKQEEIVSLKSQINKLTKLETEFSQRPNIDIRDGTIVAAVGDRYIVESCGCLLFGCLRHNNLEDDKG